MVDVTGLTRWQLVAAAAITAAGCLTAPTAAASPMLPLAPACSGKFVLPFAMSVIGATKPINGAAPPIFIYPDQSGSGNPGRANYGGAGGGTSGWVYGGLTGTHVDFTLQWDEGPDKGTSTSLGGDVRDDLTIGGNYRLSDGTVGVWSAPDTPAACLAPASSNTPAGQNTAKVTSDVDVYNVKNVPDGTGTVVGILRSPNTVALLGPCNKKDWCNVSGDAVPGGSGWVWGALNF